ncbi:glycoside hydrolase family 43 protein [Echinimonas agarilytica]|uniref:Glycoside hydrolase family 43 protein n=1 Tax=Echinimonas agarilytica TaxID=1215918 RepID=A0AA41W490_9GAMM|nr:glycoside hydrolase family 43 protein [Echinimonas agarilytica]MCM2678570.1 glycoside hydrolase family 43 protein [Echinimonas agarilytica]
MTKTIQNPILKGFNPDPSICKNGDDYYIATSTFEWFPGVQIHHSKDLGNWELVAHPLNRTSQLDMKGHPDSCGVWAPCLTFSDGLFHLIYTDVRAYQDDFKTAHNYLVTAENIEGPWSEPIFLNSSGFDPSLFHDDDGRKWLINVIWDHRPEASLNHNRPAKNFAGILIQEYDPLQQKLVGPIKNIFAGSDLGLVEGPHLYKRDGYYYMLTAEGGTFAYHGSLFARSKNLFGPYEMDPEGHLLNSQQVPSSQLRRSGHADMLELDNGDCYLVHLTGRPLPYRGRCTLGRETAIQKIVWNEQGWPRLAQGHVGPVDEIEGPHDVAPSNPYQVQQLNFDTNTLPIDFQSVRVPLTEASMSLSERPGFLRLKGNECPTSRYEQSMVARRQQAFCYTATTSIEFKPENIQQLAGLTCYYNTGKFIYLYVTHDPEQGRVLEIMMACMTGSMIYPMGRRIPLPDDGEIGLRVDVDFDEWKGAWRHNDGDWQHLGVHLDASILSDEIGAENFTGAFVGMACHDMSGARIPADFSHFSYQEREFKSRQEIVAES